MFIFPGFFVSLSVLASLHLSLGKKGEVDLTCSTFPSMDHPMSFYPDTYYFFSCRVFGSLYQRWIVSGDEIVTVVTSTQLGKSAQGFITIFVESINSIDEFDNDFVSFLWFNSSLNNITNIICESGEHAREIAFSKAETDGAVYVPEGEIDLRSAAMKPNYSLLLEYHQNTLYFFSCRVFGSLYQRWSVSGDEIVTVVTSTQLGKSAQGSISIFVESINSIDEFENDFVSFLWFNSSHNNVTNIKCENGDSSREIAFASADRNVIIIVPIEETGDSVSLPEPTGTPVLILENESDAAENGLKKESLISTIVLSFLAVGAFNQQFII